MNHDAGLEARGPDETEGPSARTGLYLSADHGEHEAHALFDRYERQGHE
jgi:hypothetical protein